MKPLISITIRRTAVNFHPVIVLKLDIIPFL